MSARYSAVLRVSFVMVAAIAGLLVAPVASQATSIGLSVATPAAQVGDAVKVNVEILDVQDLYAFQFTVTFDPLVLQAVSSDEGPFLSTGGGTVFVPGFLDNTAGTIIFLAGSLVGPGPGVSGAGTLAMLDFTASGSGVSPLSIIFDLLNGDVLLDSSLSEIATQTDHGSITVLPRTTSVPEPATAWLLSAALPALGWRFRSARKVR